MKLKLSSLFVYFLCCFPFAYAQRQNIYFLKNSGKEVKTRDSADFIRVISKPDLGSTLFNIKEFYKNNQPKLIGQSSKISPIVLEGECMTYYQSGRKQQYANYKGGRKEGDAFKYFPDGKLYSYIKYPAADLNDKKTYTNTYLIMACNDTTGKELAVEGNGHYVGYSNDFKDIEEEGGLKNGLKDGKWTGHNGVKGNSITFDEQYNDGKLLVGRSVDQDGKVYTYTVAEYEPQYKGGIQDFYTFLTQNIKYPANARAKNIQGKVFISFVVERDGKLSDVKIARSPDGELGAEALRVVNLSPNWIPGLQYGRPVRVHYTVPINFNLGPVQK